MTLAFALHVTYTPSRGCFCLVIRESSDSDSASVLASVQLRGENSTNLLRGLRKSRESYY